MLLRPVGSFAGLLHAAREQTRCRNIARRSSYASESLANHTGEVGGPTWRKLPLHGTDRACSNVHLGLQRDYNSRQNSTSRDERWECLSR